ncbi:MAG TPA: epoxide hydrolase [Amnibacterium sp.]
MTDAPAPVPDAVLDDLHERLRRFRPVPGVDGGPERGVDTAFLTELVDSWLHDYDWRAAEARLLALPWRRSADGLRMIVQEGPPGAPVVVLLHGWPDSFLRFAKVLPLLPDVTVVVPCLPGYPYSDSPGTSRVGMARPIAAALAGLGADRYVVSGGDIGTGVAEALARSGPEHVAALHLTDTPLALLATVDPADLADEERAYADRVQRWRIAEGAYMAEQATKPNTLAAALGDSPAGLAAWLVEKLRSWSDCDGDVLAVFPLDDLLTWITLYWVTGTIGTSFAPYALREPPEAGHVAAPTAVSVFPKDLLPAPRSLAERIFDVRAWREEAAGGHFGAWEQPEAFVAGVRDALRIGGLG